MSLYSVVWTQGLVNLFEVFSFMVSADASSRNKQQSQWMTLSSLKQDVKTLDSNPFLIWTTKLRIRTWLAKTEAKITSDQEN